MATQVGNPQLRYLKTQIETASQPQLLVMIFDAAVKKLHISKKAILEKNIEKAHTELTKVQKIFSELMIALDMEKGGDLAMNLLRIYDFVYHHLVRANIKQDASLIDEVLPVVDNLRDGWTQAVDKYNKENLEQSAAPASPKPASGFQALSTGIGATPSAPAQNAPKPAAQTDSPEPAKPAPVRPMPAPARTGTYGSGARPAAAPVEDRPRLNIQG
ncbi:MAG: flagellar export chaperone FliS [bacterium]|nr:flagellar export chaperone FliS [bacterium]